MRLRKQKNKMVVMREFLADFIKIKRTPILLLHVASPFMITPLFLAYYGVAGQRMISDARDFFILLQMGYPFFAGIATAAFLQADRTGSALQNLLGVTSSRKSVYLGKLFFLLFLAGINVLLYEICFCIGGFVFFGEQGMDFKSCVTVFLIFLTGNLFVYVLHMGIVLRFGTGVCVFTGICGSVFAAIFENPIGDGIWPFVPWEWGVRFLKHSFDFSTERIWCGGALAGVVTAALLLLMLVWFDRWEGESVQE